MTFNQNESPRSAGAHICPHERHRIAGDQNALSEIPPEDRKAGLGRNWRGIGDLALAAIQENARRRANAPGEGLHSKGNGDDQSSQN